MEIESEGGAAIPIERDSSTELGRWLGLGLRPPSSADHAVSRRHLSLRLGGSGDELKALFEVIGRNPILVCRGEGEEKARLYRNSENGELGDGDRFSLSLKNPSFWVVKRRGGGEGAVEQRVLDTVVRRERRTLERKEQEMKAKVAVGRGEEDEEAVDEELELELGAFGVSRVDPFKESGFLIKGHEFDHYPRHKIRSAKEWNWFLEEIGGNNDDDDELSYEGTSLKRSRRGKKHKKSGDSEDEDWTGECVDGKEIAEVGHTRKSKYSTRSKDLKGPREDDLSGANKRVKGRDIKHQKDDKEEEHETLGGFIVNDTDDDDEGDEEELEEEEVEFVEDDDD